MVLAGAGCSRVHIDNECGAGDRSRTGDLELGRLSLCQLSYSRPRVILKHPGPLLSSRRRYRVAPAAGQALRRGDWTGRQVRPHRERLRHHLPEASERGLPDPRTPVQGPPGDNVLDTAPWTPHRRPGVEAVPTPGAQPTLPAFSTSRLWTTSRVFSCLSRQSSPEPSRSS